MKDTIIAIAIALSFAGCAPQIPEREPDPIDDIADAPKAERHKLFIAQPEDQDAGDVGLSEQALLKDCINFYIESEAIDYLRATIAAFNCDDPEGQGIFYLDQTWNCWDHNEYLTVTRFSPERDSALVIRRAVLPTSSPIWTFTCSYDDPSKCERISCARD